MNWYEIALGVVLIAAFHLLIAEHHSHLIRGERIEAAVGHERLGRACSGDDYSSFESLHFLPSLFVVMVCRISASV